MTTASTATPAATVIPLQRTQQQPRRTTVDRALPAEADTAWWDAETAAMFAGEHPTRHGRRCLCCTPPAAAEAVS